ncbi:glycosyltransferase [Niveispirillum cyanobacteriorum]|uniref:Glycosyltransferase n=1 Tax=Niveispirillum cyanobacteriorum TaxID=1612173 RepID=A0A2K9NBY8_9PROT|nr:glycosyltransferase [Niveispirillum cyanobacteriorum]
MCVLSDPLKNPFILNWRLTEIHGWGLVGVHTCLHLLRIGGSPVLYSTPDLETMRPQTQALLGPVGEASRRLEEVVTTLQAQGRRLHIPDATVLYALGGMMQPSLEEQSFFGDRNVGVGAFTGTALPGKAVSDAKSYSKVVIHSTFNKQVLADHGITSDCVFQGVDPVEVFPGVGNGMFGQRYIVFSGGKTEFRKGQDLVVAAFRAFNQRHPDALLVTAWGNFWPGTALTLRESTVLAVPPVVGPEGVDEAGWLRANGLPEGSFFNCGFLSRQVIAQVLHNCDLGIFPNRCEPGTNLVAMEAMACGVPVILSANTGHLDLIGEDRTYVLSRQSPIVNDAEARRYWGESDVEELLETMEFAYQNRDDARARGKKGSDWVLGHRRWDQFAAEFVDVCLR